MLPTPDDHIAITDLLARYCIALDLDDIDAWVALFTPDSVYEVFGRDWVGEAGLRKMADRAPKGIHHGGPPVIEIIDADHAVTRQNVIFLEQGSDVWRAALYTDDLVRTGDGWRFARRRCQFMTADGLRDRPER